MVNRQLVLGCILCAAILGAGYPFGPTAGPYKVNVKKLEKCGNEGTGKVTFDNKIRSVGNGKYLYDGPIVLGVPIDEHFQMYMDFQSFGNQGYKPRDKEYTIRNCQDLMKLGGDLMKAMMEAAGSNVVDCPIPADNYTLSGWEVDVNIKSIPVMVYNDYRLVSTVLYKGVKVGCGIVYLEIVPQTYVG